MAIGELFLGAFITVMFERLASREFIKLARSAKILSELENLKSKLELIQAVLIDAGQKQITQKAVEVWLNKLEHLAYEIDDVLDDLATEATRRQLKNQESEASTFKKLLKLGPTKCDAVKYGLKMRSKIDGITTKLVDLVNQKQLLGLNENVERPNHDDSRETTSLLPAAGIVGRVGDKGTLLRWLLGSESSGQNVSVVSIVGVGGIGKSTLAQLLYKEVKNHFEAMSWVCVSDEFDVFKISMAIFKDVGGDDRKFETLNQLQVALTEKLSKKRFLLVLDDVWNDNHQKWDLLQRPFHDGSPGSKILVTTRNTKVASVMNSVQSYNLNLLPDEDALSLFAQQALGKRNFDSLPIEFKLNGEGIVKKCGGLPLALITLGRVLRTKPNVEEWEELLNSELWNLPYENDLFPALKLSYYDLRSHLKQMFAYCCLFPKDYMFDKDELVLLWMGEGFLYESNGKSLERFGRECFEELVSRSFFMLSTDDEPRYTMHDLINDLARSVAGEFFFRFDDKMDFDDKHEGLGKFHHLSFIPRKNETDKMFKALQRTRHLRTFLPMSAGWLYFFETFNISNSVLGELFPQLQFLRVLSLAGFDITCVPESIGRLKHMRYLNLSNTWIRCLPEQVGDLHNLQSLLLSGCCDLSTLPNSTTKLINLRHLDTSNTRITCLPEQVGELRNLQSLLLSGCDKLSTLPNSITKLINLRHLDIRNTRALNKTSLGIGGWTGLQNLSKIVIGKNDEFSISDLKGLWQLQGELSIMELHKVINVVQAKEAELQQKKGICDLKMEWIDDFDDSRNKVSEYEVLEVMRPFEKLRSLKLWYYGGTKFPSWVGDPTFDCLTRLTLRGCRSCTCLPTLGQLSSLQKLFVESMDGLKSLGSEFLGSSNGVAFPLLEVLEFKDMESWEEWSIDIAGAFPCLREISLINCEKLDVVVIELIPSLQVLHVEGCSLRVLKSMVGVSSSIVRLTMKNIKGLTQLPGEILEHLKKVEHLDISECDELTYLWESETAAGDILLKVIDCENLVTLGEKDLQSVKVVRIEFCKKLKSFNCPSSIEKLEIRRCDSLSSLSFPTTDDHPPTLKRLVIMRCNNVEVSWLVNNFLSSLESLQFVNLPGLRWFPEGCLVHLTSLVISGCDNIESIPDNGYGFLPSCRLRYLKIKRCKNLKSFPHKHLQSLASLEEMEIRECPNLDDSFPCGLWPPNLSYLNIGGLKKPISKWGMQNFPTSLVELTLYNDSGVVSFAKAEGEDISSFLLPSSLTYLYLEDFKELQSLSKGMQHLTCLRHLHINKCPKLRDLSKTLLRSLSRLTIGYGCSEELIKKCSINGKYWPIISQIPRVDI